MSGPKPSSASTTSSALSPGAPPAAETSSHGQDIATALAPMAARPGDERFVAHLATAGELVAASRFREAEVEVLRALSGLPADLRALNLLALVRVKLGRLEEARTTYREIAVAAPNDATARRNLGLLALKLEHVEEAIPELEMAARLAPGDKQAWSYLGYAYAKRGQTVPAAAAFRRAGQDALADELEHAVTARRPPSGPKLAALQPSGATPPPAAPPGGFEAGPRGGTPAPARPPSGVTEDAAVAPSSVVTSPPSGLGEAPRTIAATPSMVVVDAIAPVRAAAERPPVAPARAAVEPPSVGAAAAEPAPVVPEAPAVVGALDGDAAPAELAAVPLLGFVLARLGVGVSPPAPNGDALRMGVEDEAFVRSGAALAAVGVRFEPAFRRTQGRSSGEPLAPAGEPFFRLVGQGEVWVAGAPGAWQALALEDDILYVREDRVLAFDGGVSWEAGAVPGDGLRMLQFRGRGCVVLRLDAPPVAVKVTEDRPAYVARDRLLGWVGRLVPHKLRAGGPAPFDLSCQGEGVVLFEVDLAGPRGWGPASPGARWGRRRGPPLG